MGKILNAVGLLISLVLIGFISWFILYTPEGNLNSAKPDVTDGIGEHNELSEFKALPVNDNEGEVVLAKDELSQDQDYSKAKLELEHTEVDCIINQQPDFITDLKPCVLTGELKNKNFDGITNLIVKFPFEKIYKLKPISPSTGRKPLNKNEENVVEKIGMANGEAIYIKSFYEYAFPESQYSLKLTTRYFNDYALLEEEISIYPHDEEKGVTFYAEEPKSLTDPELDIKECAEINEYNITLKNNEYFLHYERCIAKGPVSDEDKVVVEFKDKVLEKCIRQNGGIKSDAPILQYNLNLIKEVACISPKIESIEGLSNIPYLITLSLNIKNIHSFEEIKKLNKLQSLTLRNKANVNLNDFLSLVNLKYLKLDKVQVKRLSVLNGFNQLKTLILENTKLPDTGFLNNINSIENLSLSGANLTEFGYYYGLNLQFLDLSHNNLNNIDWVNGYTNLKEIRINNNQLNDIDPLHRLLYLKVINAKHNQIKSASKFASFNTNIKDLNLQNNPIDCLKTPLIDTETVSLSCS